MRFEKERRLPALALSATILAANLEGCAKHTDTARVVPAASAEAMPLSRPATPCLDDGVGKLSGGGTFVYCDAKEANTELKMKGARGTFLDAKAYDTRGHLETGSIYCTAIIDNNCFY